jgi:hypothetical protein
MLDRWGRFAPLTGVLFVILVVIGGPVLEGSGPGAGAGGARVIAFYAAHRERERIGVVVLAFAFAAFLFFAAALRARWRRDDDVEGIATAMLAAATVVAVGLTVSGGLGFALTDAPRALAPASAQTLNLLANDMVVTSAVGFLAFGITAGISILRVDNLPSWSGWFAIAIGILFVIPPIEFVGFLLLLLWALLVSVLTVRRAPGHHV